METKKTQTRKTLLRRSVNRVARELKVLFDNHNKKEIYDRLRTIRNQCDSIVISCNDTKKKISEVIEKSSFRLSFLSTIESRMRDIEYKRDDINDIVKEISVEGKSKIKVEDLAGALTYLLDNYDYVAFQNNKLTVRTEDILVKHKDKMVAFGEFDIVLDLDEGSEEHITHKFVCKPLNPRMRDNHCHPNLSHGNNLCTGDGEEVLVKSFKEGRIDDFIDMIQQILRTDSNSPYKDIENWY